MDDGTGTTAGAWLASRAPAAGNDQGVQSGVVGLTSHSQSRISGWKLSKIPSGFFFHSQMCAIHPSCASFHINGVELEEASYPVTRYRLAHYRCSEVYRLLEDEPRMRAFVRPIGFPN